MPNLLMNYCQHCPILARKDRFGAIVKPSALEVKPKPTLALSPKLIEKPFFLRNRNHYNYYRLGLTRRLHLLHRSGLGMDQEATYCGLGWNMNVGSISRNLRGLHNLS